jgi:hypothetical protein
MPPSGTSPASVTSVGTPAAARTRWVAQGARTHRHPRWAEDPATSARQAASCHGRSVFSCCAWVPDGAQAGLRAAANNLLVTSAASQGGRCLLTHLWPAVLLLCPLQICMGVTCHRCTDTRLYHQACLEKFLKVRHPAACAVVGPATCTSAAANSSSGHDQAPC